MSGDLGSGPDVADFSDDDGDGEEESFFGDSGPIPGETDADEEVATGSDPDDEGKLVDPRTIRADPEGFGRGVTVDEDPFD